MHPHAEYHADWSYQLRYFHIVIIVYSDVNNKQTSKGSEAPAPLHEAGSRTSSYLSSIYALLGSNVMYVHTSN